MRLAIGFISFREAELSQIDTIPKPGGLGSGGPSEARSIRCAFIEYSMNIRCLFKVCSKIVQCRCRAHMRFRPGTFVGGLQMDNNLSEILDRLRPNRLAHVWTRTPP